MIHSCIEDWLIGCTETLSDTSRAEPFATSLWIGCSWYSPFAGNVDPRSIAFGCSPCVASAFPLLYLGCLSWNQAASIQPICCTNMVASRSQFLFSQFKIVSISPSILCPVSLWIQETSSQELMQHPPWETWLQHWFMVWWTCCEWSIQWYSNAW